MEVAAFVLSIISLTASTIMAIIQIVSAAKWNKIKIQTVICEKIFDEYLITKIPNARRLLMFDSKGTLTGAKEFAEMIVEIKKSSLYFKYNDNVFYDNLEKLLTEMEDLVVCLMNKTYDSTKQPDIYKKIDNHIDELYRIIDKKRFK